MSRVLAAAVGVLVVVVGAWWVVRVPPPPIDDQIPMASPTGIVPATAEIGRAHV